MKKSVITLLAVAALGVAAPVFATEVVKTTEGPDKTVVANVYAELDAKDKAAEEAAKVAAEEAAGNKAEIEKALADQPKGDLQPIGNGVYVSAPAKEKGNITVTEAVDKTVANAPAEMKKEEAKKEAAKPASKTVAAATTKTAAKALPKTSAVK